MPIKRGNERPLHREGKRLLARLLSQRRFLVLFEHRFADVVAFRPTTGGWRTLCGEHELTNRNVRGNVQRNFENGCYSMVILVPSESARASIRRLLRREFPRQIWIRIGVITHDTCRRQLEQRSADAINP